MINLRQILIALLLILAANLYSNEAPHPEQILPEFKSLTAGTNQSGLTYVGSCMWRGTSDAAIRGDYAYLAMNNGLMVVDISDPSEPVQASQLFMQLMWTWSIEISGNYAYLIDYYGLKIIDISNPLAPFLAGSCDINQPNAYEVALSGDYAVVAQKGNGIQIIDISDPYLPTLEGSYDTPGNARSVVVGGNLAYVADYAEGLQIIDISDPNSLDSVGALNTIGYAKDIDIEGDFAYVACRGDGVRIIDISNPQNPVYTNTFPTPGSAEYIIVDDTIAYVADSDSGMLVINIANPLSPVQVGSMEVFGRVADVDSFVSIAQWREGMSLVNINNPESPHIEGVFETPSFGYEFFFRDGYAYGPTANFDVISVLDPTAPYLIGSTDEGSGYFIDVVDSFAYVSSNDSVFRIFNIASPDDPFLVGSVADAGYSYAVAGNGDYAFSSTWQDGLVVINTLNPYNPVIETNHMDYNRRGYLELVGDLLLMEHLFILNVSDPMNPFEVGAWQTCCGTDDAAVVDSLVYLASGDSELMIGQLNIINIADPENPTYVGGYSTSNEAMSVAVDGDIACVTDGAGLYVLDVNDPANPSLIDVGGVLGMSYVEMDGGYIYVSGSYGFYVFQMTAVCGDANDDGSVNVADAVYVIQYVFVGGPPPPWICKADANGDGIINVGDAVYLVQYIFNAGPPPATACCD